MRIKIVRDTAIHGDVKRIGEVLDVSEGEGRLLINYGMAERVAIPAAKPAPAAVAASKEGEDAKLDDLDPPPEPPPQEVKPAKAPGKK